MVSKIQPLIVPGQGQALPLAEDAPVPEHPVQSPGYLVEVDLKGLKEIVEKPPAAFGKSPALGNGG